MNVAGNAIWFGQSVDRVLLSQSPKFQQDWVEGLRVVSKMGCSNGGAQHDSRVKRWRRKKGASIVFLAGRGFLPVGPRAHGPSQPRAHGVSSEFRGTRAHGPSQPRAHGVSRNILTTPCARGSETPCTRGVQKISDETSQDITAKHTISGISEEV